MREERKDRDESAKKRQKNISILRYRLVGGISFIVAFLCVWGTALVTIVRDGSRWDEISKTIRPPQYKSVAPWRGTIYSSDGRVLAVSSTNYRLFIDFKAEPLQLIEKDSVMTLLDSMAYTLSAVVGDGVNLTALKKKLKEGYRKKNRYCRLLPRDISHIEYLRLRERYPWVCYDQKGKRKKTPLYHAVYAEKHAERMNPYGGLAYRTIGGVFGDMSGDTTRGKNGIELQYDAWLKGDPGSAIVRYVGGRTTSNIVKKPTAGADVYMTLDMTLQSIAQSALEENLCLYDASRGSVALMETHTGRIVAISNLQKVSEGVYYESVNNIVSDLSEPGSTFKTPFVLAALDDGVVSPSDVYATGSGIFQIGKNYVKDHNYRNGGYGDITVEEGLMYSSNIVMAKLAIAGYADNPEKIRKHLYRYGFGQDMEIEIPGAAVARIPNASSPRTWRDVTLPWMSFGYGVNIPPIYTLAFYNAIANNGRLMRPYFVDKVVDSSGRLLHEGSPRVMSDSIAKATSVQTIQKMLYKVVQEGTGKPVKSQFVSISGKTGTAQISQGKQGYKSGGVRHMASFCGYFPSEAPQYTAIAIVLDPKGSTAGGLVAGTIIKKIAERITLINSPILWDTITPLDRSSQALDPIAGALNTRMNSFVDLGLEKPLIDKKNKQVSSLIKVGIEEDKYKYLVRPYHRGIMPDLIGVAPGDAIYLLMKQGIIVRLQGYGTVIGQSISSGIPIQYGQSVTLYLGKK